MKALMLVPCLVLSLFILSPRPAAADAGVPHVDEFKNAAGEAMEPSLAAETVMEMIRRGTSTEEAVGAALAAGCETGAVVCGAVSGGGELTGILMAVAANTNESFEQAGKMCMDCGADPVQVALALSDAEKDAKDAGKGEDEASANEQEKDKEGSYTPDAGQAGAYGSLPGGGIPTGGGGGGGTVLSPSL